MLYSSTNNKTECKDAQLIETVVKGKFHNKIIETCNPIVYKIIELKNKENNDEKCKFLCENLMANSTKSEISQSKISNNLKNVGWTDIEDKKLLAITENFENKNWNIISSHFENKSAIQCFTRWSKAIKPFIAAKIWTDEEDTLLKSLVNSLGPTKWTEISRKIKRRSRTECMNRWNFHISGSKQLRTVWLPIEELKLVLIVKKFGTFWSKITKLFEDKDEYSIKNKFYSIMRRAANIIKNKNDNLTEELRPQKSSSTNCNVFSLKLKELMNYIDDAIALLKKEQNLSNEYEEVVNTILENDSNFSGLGEKLDTINLITNVNNTEIIDNKENENLINISNNNEINFGHGINLMNEFNFDNYNTYNRLNEGLNNNTQLFDYNNVNQNDQSFTNIQNLPLYSNNNYNSNNCINPQINNIQPKDTLSLPNNNGSLEFPNNTYCNNNGCKKVNLQNKITLCKTCKISLKENLKKKIIYNMIEKGLLNNNAIQNNLNSNNSNSNMAFTNQYNNYNNMFSNNYNNNLNSNNYGLLGGVGFSNNNGVNYDGTDLLMNFTNNLQFMPFSF